MTGRRRAVSRIARDANGRPIVCVVCALPFRAGPVPLDRLCSACALDMVISDRESGRR